MKTLYLVRHAKSSWDNPQLSDFERPLNKRGIRDAPKMGAWLGESGLVPDLIITSPAVRARTTAFTFARHLNYPDERVKEVNGMYLASSRTILREIIQPVPSQVDTLILFGHNPGLTELANELCNADIVNVPTSGVVHLQIPVDHWSDVAVGSGQLLSFDYPKKFD